MPPNPTPADDGCCALSEGHDGRCAYICSDCNGSTRCHWCDGPSGDDMGHCFSCHGGMTVDA